MSYILDIIIVAVIVIAFIIGTKKGIVKSLIDLCGGIIAAILASLLSTPISTYIFNSFVRDGLYERIHKQAKISEGLDFVNKIYEPLPNFVKSLLDSNGVTEESITQSLKGNADAMANSMVDIMSPVFIAVIKFFVLIVLFLILLIAISAVGKIIEPILHLPIINEFNGILGGLFGLFFGILIMWVCLSLLNIGSHLLSENLQDTVDVIVKQSFLFEYFLKINPIDWFN